MFPLPFAPNDDAILHLWDMNVVSIGGRGLFMASNLKDPGYPVVGCSIYGYLIPQALCDLGASVDIMSKAMIEKLNHPPPTSDNDNSAAC